ncbi:MAG: hypothetical protein PHP11_03680 [Erysipelotrichaceae bacterium]|nr:hypothetical protein [Erysipelotrichaceae bacterium]
MSKLKEKTKKVFKWTKSNTILTVGIIVIMIPITFVGVMLIRAYFATGEPINGNRIDNERAVEITQTQLDEINSQIKGLSEVETVEIQLKVATVRVYVDIKNTVLSEDYESLLTVIYSKIDDELPIADYFTNQDTLKQYDLEIHLYNDLEATGDTEFIYYIMNKNAAMAEPQFELVSEPRNAELADELRGDTVSEGVIEGEDQEGAGEQEDDEAS